MSVDRCCDCQFPCCTDMEKLKSLRLPQCPLLWLPDCHSNQTKSSRGKMTQEFYISQIE